MNYPAIQTMPIKLITNKDEWKRLAADLPFLQSWEWGEILASENKKIERLAITDGSKLIALFLAVYTDIAILGRYVFCPKGPAVGIEDAALWETELKKYLTERGGIFFRFEPPVFRTSNLPKRKTIDINPRATLVLDLNFSAEKLLAAMHPKTRYNIRLAEKKGLVIDARKNWDIFWKLMRSTGKRDKFSLHESGHYQAVLKNAAVTQLTALYEGEPVASAILIGSGKTLTYLYGASDYRYRHLMAPYLLQWEAIKLAKAKGYQSYDFFGVAPNIGDTKNYIFDHHHQYAGVTRFKLGFGGRYEEVPGTFDLIIDRKRYWVYKIIRAVRRML